MKAASWAFGAAVLGHGGDPDVGTDPDPGRG